MPLYMDIHTDLGDLTPEAVADAHRRDTEVQERHGVEYLRYWYNTARGQVFCLVRAPTPDAARRVHEEAHGLLADEIIEVQEGS